MIEEPSKCLHFGRMGIAVLLLSLCSPFLDCKLVSSAEAQSIDL